VTILLNEFTFDRTPPALTCPEGLSVLYSVREGAMVDFSAAAVDDCDPSPAVACDHPPDGAFPVGITVVTCTATDAAGNRSECRFEVQVICDGQLPGNCNQDGAVDISEPSASSASSSWAGRRRCPAAVAREKRKRTATSSTGTATASSIPRTP
jgi:hypothetical protein